MNWIEIHKAAKLAQFKSMREAAAARDAAEYAELRAKYPDMTDAQFEAVHGYAWQEGHAHGYSEVALIFDDLADVCRAYAKAAKP